MNNYNKPCIACSSTDSFNESYIEGWGHEIFLDLEIQICRDCGLGSVIDEPTIQEINLYYDEIYRSKDSMMFMDFLKIVPSRYHPRSFSQLLLARNFIDCNEKINIVDIGPGSGESYYASKDLFPNSDIFFVEKTIEARKLYKKYFDIHIINNLSEANIKFDLILLSHSLEHFNKDGVKDLLDDLQENLSEDGIIVIEVPNNDFRDKIHKDGLERLQDTPHLQFFSIESLTQLFNNNGFETIFNNSTGALINLDMPENISHMRNQKREITVKKDYSKGTSENGIYTSLKFRKYITNYLWEYLHIIGLNRFIKFLKYFAFKNGFDDSQFLYGGQRTSIRTIVKKKN